MGALVACFRRRSGSVHLTDPVTRRAIEEATRQQLPDASESTSRDPWLEASEINSIKEEQHEISIDEEPHRDQRDLSSLPVHRGKSTSRKMMSPRGESSDSISEVALDSPDESSDSPKARFVTTRRAGAVRVELPPKKGGKKVNLRESPVPWNNGGLKSSLSASVVSEAILGSETDDQRSDMESAQSGSVRSSRASKIRNSGAGSLSETEYFDASECAS
eukprot:TRINITY_DN10950_c0_g1_i1.p1 TRINITY_DN10950_c0_g1~~TRINITY_DN10950_c0_g1_i1.p1  ORF type:complete len:219 (+),score=13.26 TRINITY_DN10950_c0_g1_i1:130-786(+)